VTTGVTADLHAGRRANRFRPAVASERSQPETGRLEHAGGCDLGAATDAAHIDDGHDAFSRFHARDSTRFAFYSPTARGGCDGGVEERTARVAAQLRAFGGAVGGISGERGTVLQTEPIVVGPWRTAKQAAAYAQVGTKLIYRAVARGDLRAARIDARRTLRFKTEWIDQWLEGKAELRVLGR
jgi:excisionase family DNA binding protein